jgi:hypothetical protein
MPELFRSLASRLRAYVGDRRHTDRHRARLTISVSLVQKTRKLNGARPDAALLGETRDVSSDGLAIIVPAIHIDGHHLVGEGRALLVELQLPERTIPIKVEPVRYERLDEDEANAGYLIGLRITELGGDERVYYDEYIANMLEK